MSQSHDDPTKAYGRHDDSWRDDRTRVIRPANRAASQPSAPYSPQVPTSEDSVDEFLRDLHLDLDDIPEDAPQPQPQAAPRVTAYNRDYTDAERAVMRAEGKPVPRRTKQKPKSSAAAEQPAAPTRRAKHSSGHKFGKVLLVLLVLLVLAALALWFLVPSRPDRTVNKDGNVATILLAGTDADGMRTDTMMLMYLDYDAGSVRLLSLPRDSRTIVDDEDMKLNAVYSYGGCGESGMELLMQEMPDVIGYMPDGYVLLSLDALVKVVDAMGGITFDVPMDMYYDDPSQDLYIDLQEGTQKLDGQQAMQVLRYRSGYALADLQRVNVQRDVLSAAINQWLRPTKVLNAFSALSILQNDALTDLSFRNFLWLAKAMLHADLHDIPSLTLPGEWNSPYYELYYTARAEMINEYFNPTTQTFTGDDFDE